MVVMILATPLIAEFALRFGPAEYFALTVLGLSVVSSLSGGSMLKGFISCFFGLFLATVGTDGITGEERFTFNTVTLLGGINFVVVMVGLSAVSEIFIEAEEPFQEYNLSTRPDVVYGIFVSMLLTNLLMLVLVGVNVRLFLELNRLPYSVFSAGILILCVVGAYGLNNSMDDVFLMFAFSAIGYFMRKFGMPVAPCILGLVLGDLAELSFRRALLIADGSPLGLVNSPISVILLAGAFFSILYPFFKKPKMLAGS